MPEATNIQYSMYCPYAKIQWKGQHLKIVCYYKSFFILTFTKNVAWVLFILAFQIKSVCIWCVSMEFAWKHLLDYISTCMLQLQTKFAGDVYFFLPST